MTRRASFVRLHSVPRVAVALSLIVLMGTGMSQAQTTKITSSGLNTRVTTSGTTTFIDGGTRPGSTSRPNLFHSFGDFSIGTTDTALFRAIDVVGGVDTTYSGSSIQNIIGRVTGSNPSSLFGTLDTQTNFPTANLFLVNPNGIVFGANSTINVGGSANFVAGDYLRMTDNALFFANPAQTSTLSVAAVHSFGFLAGNPLGTIRVEGGTVKNTSALTLVGRDKVDGTTVTPGIEVTGTLSNIGGKVTLVSVGSPTNAGTGEVTATDQTPTGFDSLGTIALKPGAAIDTSTNASINNPLAAGAIVIRGDRLEMDGASLRAISRGDNSNSSVGPVDLSENVTAGAIALTVDTLTMHNSTLETGSDGVTGRAGQITVEGLSGPATSVSLDNSTISTTISGGTATTAPASIQMTAHTIALTNGTQIISDTSGAAPAGDIALQVDTLRANVNAEGAPIEGAPVVISSESTNPTDQGGAAGSVTISGFGSDPAHAATLVALNNMQMGTLIEGGTAETTPGTITMTTNHLVLSQEKSLGDTFIASLIDTLTRGAANAGSITLNVDQMTSTSMLGEIFIESGAGTTGIPGTIRIQGLAGPGSAASSVDLRGTDINSGGLSSGGEISITANQLNLLDTQIDAASAGAGNAGDITLNVGTLTADGSTISTTSEWVWWLIPPDALPPDIFDIFFPRPESLGRAGTIRIQGVAGGGSAASTISLTNSFITSGQYANTIAAGGGGGEITITANQLNLLGAGITVQSQGSGNAGDITLNVGTLTADSGPLLFFDGPVGPVGPFPSVISTTSFWPWVGIPPDQLRPGFPPPPESLGSAGTIRIQGVAGGGSAASTISLTDSVITSEQLFTSSDSSTAGGDITITARNIDLHEGALISTKTLENALAGDITLLSATDLTLKGSTISTSAAQASGGNIKLTAPNLIHLVDSTVTSSVQGQAGSNGGNISIDPQFVVIQNSQILANANAGAGGSITITATGAVLVDPNSRIDASAGPAGISGSVNINAPIQILSGTLVPLKLAYSQAGLSGDRCAADPTGQFSSFVQTGRDGVPQVPGALSPSPLSFLETLTSGSWESQVPNWAALRLGLDAVSFDDSTLFRFHSACRS